MPVLHTIIDKRGAFPNPPLGENDPEGVRIDVVAVEGGMQSGLPSIILMITLEDGTRVVAETSARLFLMSAHMISERFPELKDMAGCTTEGNTLSVTSLLQGDE